MRVGLVWLVRMDVSLLVWLVLVWLVWFGLAGLVWFGWFGLDVLLVGLADLLWLDRLCGSVRTNNHTNVSPPPDHQLDF